VSFRRLAGSVLGVAASMTTAPGESRTATLRRSNSILFTELALDGVALAGATSLVARRDNLSKWVRAGARFQVAGVTGAYEVAADSQAEADAITLTFAPALAGPAADGAALTFTRTYGESPRTRVPSTSASRDEKNVASGLGVVLLEWATPEPTQGDQLDGREIVEVLSPGNAYHHVVFKVTP
jgi:hypothetical protein